MNSFIPQRRVKQFLTIKVDSIKNERRRTIILTTMMLIVTSRTTHDADLNLSSSSLGIRVNRVYPKPSVFLDSLLLSLWCFPVLEDHHFYVSFNCGY